MDPVITLAIGALLSALAGLILALTAYVNSLTLRNEMKRTQEHIRHIDSKVDKHLNGGEK